MSEQFAERDIRREFLTELLFLLGPHTEGRAGKESKNPVSRSIAEKRTANIVECGVLTAEGPHRGDGVGILFGGIEDGCVEKERDVLLISNHLQHDGVEEDRVAFGIAVEVFQEDLVEHATLSGPAVVIAHVTSRTQHPQTDLAGGVAAEHRTVLHKHHFQSLPSGGDGRTSASDASSHDHKVGGERDCFQTTGQGGWFCNHEK